MPPKIRPTIAALTSASIFLLVIAVVPSLMGGPLKRMDYLVIGTMATLLSLLSAYLFVLSGWFKPTRETQAPKREQPPL